MLIIVSGLALALPGASAQSTVAVEIPNGAGGSASAAPGYTPDSITVVVGVNNTITWTNYDTTDNTVTSVSVPPGAAAFDSGMLGPTRGMPWQHIPGGTYTENFTVPGTYQYQCTLHAWMTGTIVVKAAATPVPEFPAASLAAILFVVIAAATLVVPVRSRLHS